MEARVGGTAAEPAEIAGGHAARPKLIHTFLNNPLDPK
jgi:hypothetical protein